MDDQDRSGPGGGPPWWARLPSPPGMVSANQLQTALDEIRSRRAEVAALRDHLATLDQQLVTLEEGLRPLLAWASAWAELERGALGVWRPQPPDA